MRTALLAYLTANLTGSIKTSQELPFEESGTPMYFRNMRKVYLDEPAVEQIELIPTLDNTDINQTVTTVKGFLTLDAKTRNADIDSVLTVMAAARNGATNTDSFRKEFDYTTSIDTDRITYEFEYRYYSLA